MSIDEAIDDLRRQDYFIWDHFLSPSEMVTLKADYDSIRREGHFKAAQIGKHSSENNRTRTDETHWLEPNNLSAAQSQFWARLETLKNQINEALYLGLWSLEGHYSFYPKNGYYHEHLDRFKNDDTRTLSMVLYFNERWLPNDGGELRIQSQKISPISGRLICFLSSTVLHEVMITHEPRHSFAGWWRRRP